MTIYETIQKDKLLPTANRALLSLIMGEICIDGKPMSDKDAIVRLSQMVKTCNKNIELYDKSDNPRCKVMILSEILYMNIIEKYLPTGASKEDIKLAIGHLAVELNMKSMGKVIGYLKSKFQVVDGNLVKSVLLGD